MEVETAEKMREVEVGLTEKAKLQIAMRGCGVVLGKAKRK